MKILLCTRADYLTSFAGDSMLVLKTEQFLKSMGLSVDINNGNITDFSPYYIIHLFNLTRINETYLYFKMAQIKNKKIVLTPIYWNLKKYYDFIKDYQYIKQWEYYKKFRKEIVSGCSMLYPSSILEMNQIQKDYEDTFPFKIIYNGVDTNYQDDEIITQKLYPLKPYILCVSRICKRKNQLELCEVSNKLGINLILTGKVNSNTYLNKCLKYKNVNYMGFTESKKLKPFYTNAMFHILCGFVETPGLSNLEAGYWGCNIVSTIEGSASEYFNDLALYLNPYDKADISDTIEKAACFNKQPNLKNHIEKNYKWETCFMPLYQSYFKL